MLHSLIDGDVAGYVHFKTDHKTRRSLMYAEKAAYALQSMPTTIILGGLYIDSSDEVASSLASQAIREPHNTSTVEHLGSTAPSQTILRSEITACNQLTSKTLILDLLYGGYSDATNTCILIEKVRDSIRERMEQHHRDMQLSGRYAGMHMTYHPNVVGESSIRTKLLINCSRGLTTKCTSANNTDC